MKNVKYINAGAGSGKTYELTELLAEDIKAGKVSPDQVVLTTFTRKAAAEFKEKAKAKLFSKGLFQEANLLDGALISTIHGVAMEIISRFWYYLGIPDNPRAIDQENQDVYVAQSLSRLASEEELDFFAEFARKFDIREAGSNSLSEDYWRRPLREIINFATYFEIEDFTESVRRSKAFYRGMVDPAVPPLPSEAEFAGAIDALILFNEAQTSGAAASRVEKLKKIRHRTASPSYYDYREVNALGRTPKGAMKLPEVAAILPRLERFWQSEDVCRLVEKYIDVMFDLAGRWREAYAEFKKKRRLLDYNDMEKYLLDLLRDPRASREIGKQYRYIYVDEFQDCSPIQVKIFTRLAELARQSYWVGDIKQAIYGFRGTDIRLPEAVAGAVEGGEGCSTKTLEYSWRSVPAIVEYCNAIFTRAFAEDIPEEKVRLKPRKDPDPAIQPLVALRGAGARDVAAYVKELVDSGVRPSDIAVLDRTSYGLQGIGETLASMGIAVNQATVPIGESRATQLAKSVLAAADNEADTLAKAEVAFMTDPLCDTEHIISETLAHTDPESGETDHSFLDDNPILKRLGAIRPRLRRQSVAQFVESTLLELNIFEEARKCAPGDEARRVLETIISSAADFENRMGDIGEYPTIHGFIDYLDEGNVLIPGDPDGVFLGTMHSSKGLEWKYVIVCSLDADPLSKLVRHEVFGVHFRRDHAPSADDFFPPVYLTLHPYIYGHPAETKLPEEIERAIHRMPMMEEIRRGRLDEEKRLLYVAMTRPTHQLALLLKGREPLRKMSDFGVGPELLGIGDLCKERELTLPDELEEYESEAEEATYPVGDDYSDAPLRDRSPSLEEGLARVRQSFETGGRVPVGPLPEGKEMNQVGTCIHHIFELCGCDAGRPDSVAGESMVSSLIEAYGLTRTLAEAPTIAEAWRSLVRFLEERHGKIGAVGHERPFVFHSRGAVYRGSIDLTVETAGGLVLVDFKTSRSGNAALLDENDRHFAGRYGGQLNCYRAALKAAGQSPAATYLYYPISGLLVELE